MTSYSYASYLGYLPQSVRAALGLQVDTLAAAKPTERAVLSRRTATLASMIALSSPERMRTSTNTANTTTHAPKCSRLCSTLSCRKSPKVLESCDCHVISSLPCPLPNFHYLHPPPPHHGNTLPILSPSPQQCVHLNHIALHHLQPEQEASLTDKDIEIRLTLALFFFTNSPFTISKLSRSASQIFLRISFKI